MTVYFRQPGAPDSNSEAYVAADAIPQPDRAGGVYRGAGKRGIDALLVLLALPVVLPVVALCALLVTRDGASPFFWQRRVGRGGRVFHMLKLRTMVPDAESQLQAYLDANPAARAEWEHSQKLRNDPRITPLGRFLRKSSLDELPQLWNVLRGEMSLIGPRPMMPDQRALYPGAAYYEMRPGITGLWQVSARNETSFADRARYDADYYRHLSAGTDLSILLRTVRVVVKGTGY